MKINCSLTREDADTFRLDLDDRDPEAVCWCYRTAEGTRYASSAQANALLLREFDPEDGMIPVLLPGEKWEAAGRKPNLLPALRRLFQWAIQKT